MSNMVVNTNVASINSHRNMKKVGTMQMNASARLSSGLRINSAADDAAGLAISEKMRSQIRGLDMASKNAQDGISLIQTAEGGMQEIENMLQRMRELSVQAKNGTNTSSDVAKLQLEATELITEIGDMSNRVEFNTQKLLTGTSYTFQIGANDSQTMTATIDNVSGLGSGGSNIKTVTLSALDADIEKVSTARAKLGAYQNRLEYTIKSLDVSSENLSAAESRIRDTDMGKEMMNLTKANVLQQASTSMLAQANQNPQMVLQLLR